MAKSGSIRFEVALFWAGVFNIATGWAWDVPMCVQPMKTIAAVAITEGLTPVEVAGAGLGTAVVVLLLGVTQAIETINALVPQVAHLLPPRPPARSSLAAHLRPR